MEVNITQKDIASMLGDAANGGDKISELSPFPSTSQTPMLKPEGGVCRSIIPPPFLMKLREIVDNPETNSIISWSPSKESFIIWDTSKFSAQLLPKYFRHSNFASFTYQLNNYGFRKISYEQCEYANPWFQEGREHWVKYIRRRNQETVMQEKEFSVEMGVRIKKLRTAQTDLELEIEKLREQGGKLKNELDTIEGDIQATHSEQEKMLVGLIPIFIQQSVVQHLRDNQGLGGTETTKAQSHVGLKSLETSEESANKVTGPSVDSERENQEDTMIIKPGLKPLCSSGNSGSSTQSQKANAASGNADETASWKKAVEAVSGQEDGGQGDQSPSHCKSNLQADDSIESSVTVTGENPSAKPADAGENLSAKPAEADAEDLQMDSS